MQHVRDAINKEIASKSSHFFLSNYEDELQYEKPEAIRKIRNMYIPPQAQADIHSRIALYANWKYPGLEIGCRDGEWTNTLVASDPLYMVDEHQEFLDSAIKDYPPEYQRRVRRYLVKDNDYSRLPQRQFNFIFSWNHHDLKFMRERRTYRGSCACN